MADIEIQKFYEQIRSLKQKLAFIEQRVSTISALTSGQTLNNIDNARFNTHQGNGNIHYPKSAIRLNDLGDMTETSVVDLELLSYDLTNLKWINRTQHEAIPETKFFIGTCIEKFHALVTSAGGVITLTLTEVNAGDLTMIFSDGYTTLATSGSITIVLTAGLTDAAPQTNYIYILQSGKVLAKSTAAWPSAEHIKIGYFVVPTAVFVAANNVYVNQNWNEGNDVQGHLSDMAQRMRQFGAQYFSGIDPAGTSDYLTIAASNVEFKSGAGVVWQIHDHAFGAFDTSTGDLILVKNWNGDSYHDITDLFNIVADSAGVSLANKWFKMVVWGIGNKEGELDFIVINLPNSSYTTEAKATEDKNNSADYAIPRQYSIESSTGFLICEIVVKQQTTWDYGSTKDLRGLSSASAVAGAVGTGVTDHASLTSIDTDSHHTKYTDAEVDAIVLTHKNIATAHHAATVAGDLDHNDLANIDAGDINHLTDAQVTALHTKYTDVEAKAAAHGNLGAGQDLEIVYWVNSSSQIESIGIAALDLFRSMTLGSTFEAWISLGGRGTRLNNRFFLADGVFYGWNTDGGASQQEFLLPLATALGSLKLHVAGIRWYQEDADANNYITRAHIKGITIAAGGTTIRDITTNETATGEKPSVAGDKNFTGVDCSSYFGVYVYFESSVNADVALDVTYLQMKYYYDT